MRVPYFEMSGAGNRIVVVDRRDDGLPPPSADTLRHLVAAGDLPRFDQLMWVGPAGGGHDASYRVFNIDGSEAEQCGNGLRCVVRVLAGDGGGTSFELDSPAGTVAARLRDDGRISVSMGVPEFAPERVPFLAEALADRYPLEVSGETWSVAALSMGNPHCVLDVESVTAAEVARLGALIENHPRFPRRTNVGFRHIVDAAHIDLRVFERGVGETPACGTGACAAAVAGRREGLLGDEVTVSLPGGQLVVSWPGGDAPVWLTGGAELIQEGAIDL